jgi:predicted ATPase
VPGPAAIPTAPRTGQLRLIGTAAFSVDGRSVVFEATRRFQLLVYLACRDTWVTRDQLASLFWSERHQHAARSNLRKVLFEIQKLVWLGGFETQGEAVRWSPDSDLRRFEAAYAASDWARVLQVDPAPLAAGVDGDASPEYVAWLAAQRDRFTTRWHDAAAARLAEFADLPVERERLAQRLLAIDALDESAQVAALESALALGRTEQARRSYEAYAERLLDELGVEPSARLRELATRWRPHRAGVARAAPPASDLVGRRVELRELSRLLADRACRVLSITGAGGIGKSRLARAAYERCGAQFELAAPAALDDLSDIAQVAPRIAGALGLELSGAHDPVEQVCARLAGAHALLLLDNAEHLAGFAALARRLIEACPRLTLLVTSRARLGLALEIVLPLEGLAVPDADETEADALRVFDAIELFHRAALAARPSFDLDAEIDSAAALVRALQGLPLAIELAAAWVRVLPVTEIAAELAQSLDLLERSGDGERTDAAPERNRSVRASFGHSWNLLAPSERQALMQLSVFPAAFSRAAASHVAGAKLPVLAALVDKSLLEADGRGRFRFHPLVRQFALAKLDQSATEGRAARARHAEHFVELLARYDDFDAVEQREAVEAIGADSENALAAWQWAIGERRVDLLSRCTTALQNYFDVRGQHRFGLAQIERAAAVLDDADAGHERARCQLELARASLCYRLGEFVRGETAARAALGLARGLALKPHIRTSLGTLGLMLWRLGRLTEAAFCLRDVVRRARADGDATGLPVHAVNLSALEGELGRYDASADLAREALAEFRRRGHHVGALSALNQLCIAGLNQGRLEAVIVHAREALDLSAASGFVSRAPYFHKNLADAYMAKEDLAAAGRHAQLALDGVRAGGDRTLEPGCLASLARIAQETGAPAAALGHLQAAARLVQAMQSPRAQILVILGYARWCIATGHAGKARALIELCARHAAASHKQRAGAAELLAGLGSVPVGVNGSGPGPVESLDLAVDALLREPAEIGTPSGAGNIG